MSETRVFADKAAIIFGKPVFFPQLLNVSRAALLPLLDALCMSILPICQTLFTNLLAEPRQYLAFWGLLAVVTILQINSHNGYRSWQEHRAGAAKLAVRCFIATAVVMLTLAILAGHQHAVSRHWTTAELVLPPLLLVFTRSVTAASLVSAPPEAGPVIVCFNRYPRRLTHALNEQHITPRPSGVLFLGQASGGPPADAHGLAWPVIPNILALLAMVRDRHVRDVVFVQHSQFDALSNVFRHTMLSELLAQPVRIWLAVSMDPELTRPLPQRLARCRLVPVANDRLINSLNPMKRLFDIVVGVLLLALTMPLLAAIALAVRCSGADAVVFRQRRTGAQGRQFNVLKFCTMKHCAGDRAAGTPFTQAVRGDRRVTPIGRFLRRTSLDELLQLVNVIRGEMSLVGPRPHAPETQVQGVDFEQAARFYRLRHRVKPGMTGLAQIRGHRGETTHLETLERRIASDLEYIDSWSIWLDISIMLRTLPTLITQRNAY